MDKRVLILSGATMVCALGIGFFMQQSASPRSLDAPGQTASVDVAASGAQALQIPAEPESGAFKIENITLTSVPRVEAQELQGETPGPATLAAAEECALAVTALARPGAMVDIAVSAPCQAGARLTVHHHGMMFTTALDEAGAWRQMVPALASAAVFILEPEGGKAEVAAVPVPDLAEVDRVVLQWSGNSGFEIHARENGAEYGAAGHVWHGSDPEAGQGRMLRLGDADQLAPRLAEVYSLARGSEQGSTVDLSVETEITAINCGRDIEAQVLTLGTASDDQRLRTRDLTLAMPDCTAEGDFLVLNNLLENLKIAAN